MFFSLTIFNLQLVESATAEPADTESRLQLSSMGPEEGECDCTGGEAW